MYLKLKINDKLFATFESLSSTTDDVPARQSGE